MFFSFISFLLTFFALFSDVISANCSVEMQACGVSSLNEDISRDLQALQQNSTRKIEELFKDKNFQDLVVEIQDKGTSSGGSLKDNPSSTGNIFVSENFPSFTSLPDSSFLNPVTCYVFVSLSMGEKALLHMAEEAKKYEAILILRGFPDGSYRKTVHSLQKIITKTGQGVLIDPELFSLFGIESVPTIVLSKSIPFLPSDRVQTPLHDRLLGHVSLRYALEAFAKEGDLKQEAQALLKRGVLE